MDCTNRYKNSEGNFAFTIKLPKDREIINTSLAITKDYNGTVLYSTSLEGFRSKMVFKYSDETSNYYDLTLSKYVDAGVGIKLYHYYYDQDLCYMATDTVNGSITEGRGYWLSA